MENNSVLTLTVKFDCPLCGATVEVKGEDVDVIHLDGDVEWPGEVHLKTLCPSCGEDLELHMG
ncbi:MAG: hypothetical protein WC824_12960 [Bacteroidota bacterium]|jgi:predicted RNA-binding Zn-ribbon protein involved in translation (DUF1610 family)